ncbi:MAG TPA: ATP-dependent Clp protease ATP-binding subunit, partial [Candidatus Wolfebacteria bacterium]|nr:ATP-dependent Clp protease ATP-binding subunit [Candidatus Wolfebacteria bacterium]
MDYNFYFKELRLEMATPIRFLTRLASYCFYAILAVATLTFLLSDIEWLFWIGVLLLLFLIDRIIHFGQAERSLIGLLRRLPRPSRRNFGKEKKESQAISINIAGYLTSNSLNVLERAFGKSLIVGGDFYLYLLKFIFEHKEIKEGILRMDISLKEFKQRIEEEVDKSLDDPHKNKAELLSMVVSLVKKAFELALLNKSRFIEQPEIFSALAFVNDERINRFFNLFSINSGDLEKALIFGRFKKRFYKSRGLPITLGGFISKPHRRSRHRVMNRAWTSRPTPFLDDFSIDFTDLARREKVGFLIGHQQEYDRLIDILARPTKPNVLLIGEPGSGKETTVMHLAFNLIKDEVPDNLFDKRLVALRIGNLVSGASPDEISKRLNRIVEEITATGNIILYIPDIHNLVKTSGEGYLNAADILMPLIRNDVFPIIGATYPKEYKQLIETQSDFSHAFEIIRVEEVSEDDAIRILTYSSIILERQYKLIVSFGAVKQSVILAHKYFRYKFLPSSAEDLLKEALADASQRKEKILSADMVITIAERKTNIPIHRAGKKELEKLLNLEEIIHERLIDQDEAVKSVSRALREYRSGLSRKGGPISTFLFVGPTGVGKTELSKILSSIQFGSEDLMVRFDMSEYQTKQSILRFIGSPDGKIVGTLTEAIIQKPYSLILLDEFEKAHPDILNLFLQVFDDGRLTDSLGRTVDFQNTIIIATSNAHSNFIKTEIEAGRDTEDIAKELKKKLTDYFRPELLNRFSSVIVFKNLSKDDIKAIAWLKLNGLAKTLEKTHGISLIFDETAVERIAELGYDPVFGARPLRGVISDKLRSVLAEKILKGEISRGGTINIVFEDGEIKFT